MPARRGCGASSANGEGAQTGGVKRGSRRSSTSSRRVRRAASGTHRRWRARAPRRTRRTGSGRCCRAGSGDRRAPRVPPPRGGLVQVLRQHRHVLVEVRIDGDELAGALARVCRRVQAHDLVDRAGELQRRTAVEQDGQSPPQDAAGGGRGGGQVQLPTLHADPVAHRGDAPPRLRVFERPALRGTAVVQRGLDDGEQRPVIRTDGDLRYVRHWQNSCWRSRERSRSETGRLDLFMSDAPFALIPVPRRTQPRLVRRPPGAGT